MVSIKEAYISLIRLALSHILEQRASSIRPIWPRQPTNYSQLCPDQNFIENRSQNFNVNIQKWGRTKWGEKGFIPQIVTRCTSKGQGSKCDIFPTG